MYKCLLSFICISVVRIIYFLLLLLILCICFVLCVYLAALELSILPSWSLSSGIAGVCHHAWFPVTESNHVTKDSSGIFPRKGSRKCLQVWRWNLCLPVSALLQTGIVLISSVSQRWRSSLAVILISPNYFMEQIF